MQVYFVYKSLAHPEGGSNSYVQPFTLEERLMHVAEARRTLGATVPWLCDTMANDLKHALGDRPNSEFVLDPEGRIVSMRDWSNPDTLRSELEELVGKVDNPTRIADLDLKIETTPKPAASGVVPRIKLPGGLQPLLVEPQAGKTPFYVKLRAEAEQSVLRGESGKLYLGFHLDPLYHVHWNNLAKPVSYEVVAPEGVTVSPAKGEAEKPKVDADIDPREFLVDVEDASLDKPLELTVRYFACNDEKGFCIPVTQKYLVHLNRDRDGGQARRGGARPGGADRGTQPSRPNSQNRQAPNGAPGGRGFSVERLFRMDRNNDGKIARDELPPPMQRNFDRMDTNSDGFVSRDEAKAVEERMRRRSGQ